MPEAMALPCLPPKSNEIAPARYEYGPIRVKATEATSKTGSAGEPPNCVWPSNHKPALDNSSPIKMIIAQPLRPSLSLMKPANGTGTPPKSGKSALTTDVVSKETQHTSQTQARARGASLIKN